MRRLSKVFFFVAVLSLLITQVVNAGDYISDAVLALQHSSVYVAPATQGTDSYTSGKLQNMLRSDDNIVLIMLPADADSNTNIQTIVSTISEKLGNQRTIGLAVGDEVIGYGSLLPSGVAADQMVRANSVSNDPVTALGTFAQNMHKWLDAHPQPTPTPLQSQSSPKGQLTWLIWPLVFAVAAVIAVTIATRYLNKQTSNERTHFIAPNQIKDLMATIAKEREQVKDSELSQMVYQLCLDIEKYFKTGSNDKRKDSLFFNERLTEVSEVLIKYLDVQGNKRYYYEPETLLRNGKESIRDFASYVLDSIRRGNATDLLDFKVNTNILKAQRYS